MVVVSRALFISYSLYCSYTERNAYVNDIPSHALFFQFADLIPTKPY